MTRGINICASFSEETLNRRAVNDTLEKINVPENLLREDIDNLTLVYNLLESYGKY